MRLSQGSGADNTGNLSTVAQMTTGGYVSCARLDVGWVACWGRNTDGQLGVASGDAATSPPSSGTPRAPMCSATSSRSTAAA